MQDKKKQSLEKIAVELRTTLQSLLREQVKTLKEREKLARAIKRSRSHIESMLYEGKGGLDSWVKAFAYCFNIDRKAVKAMQKGGVAPTIKDKADLIWFKIRDELQASPEDRYYYARIALAACEIKKELVHLSTVRPRTTSRK